MEYTFATVPLFTFMGLVVSKAGMGSDVYEVMSSGFRRVKGGIGMATRGSIPKIMEMAGVQVLPPEAGVAWIRRELASGRREEVRRPEDLG